MSIKEAIENGLLNRGRRVLTQEDFSDVGYEKAVLIDGWEFLKSTGANAIVKDLLQYVTELHQDANLSVPKLVGLDKISRTLTWNKRPSDNNEEGEVVSALRVESRPKTNQIVIWGGDEAEILSSDQWIEERVLEDAMVRAYNRPITMPARLPEDYFVEEFDFSGLPEHIQDES